jgi:adenylate cyclase
MKARTRLQLRTLAVMVALVCLTTPLFNWLTTGKPESAPQGVLDGFIIATVAGGYLIFVRDGVLRGWMRRWRFTPSLLLNSAVLATIFLVGRGLGQVISAGDPAEFAESFRDDHIVYAALFFVGLSVILIFGVQMNRMIGPNVLRYFVMGSYHRPRDEDRVFLFLDLEGSTHLAEELGSSRYFALLRRFVDDLTDPVLEASGQIYLYAGDEVLVTWSDEDALEDGNCVRCYFDIRDAIDAAAPAYQRDFGTVPRVRAGVHGGRVIAGELGDVKQEIVYVGDVLNVTARLEEYAKREKLGLVVSDELLARLELPPGLVAEPRGHIVVRGRRAGLAVSHVSRARTAPVLGADRAGGEPPLSR